MSRLRDSNGNCYRVVMTEHGLTRLVRPCVESSQRLNHIVVPHPVFVFTDVHKNNTHVTINPAIAPDTISGAREIVLVDTALAKTDFFRFSSFITPYQIDSIRPGSLLANRLRELSYLISRSSQ